MKKVWKTKWNREFVHARKIISLKKSIKTGYKIKDIITVKWLEVTCVDAGIQWEEKKNALVKSKIESLGLVGLKKWLS